MVAAALVSGRSSVDGRSLKHKWPRDQAYADPAAIGMMPLPAGIRSRSALSKK